MLGFRKQSVAQPKEASRFGSRTWCRCGARIARCARCGDTYCPRCDHVHLVVWGKGAPVYVCQDVGQGGAGWR